MDFFIFPCAAWDRRIKADVSFQTESISGIVVMGGIQTEIPDRNGGL